MIINANSIVQHVIVNQKWNNDKRQCECKKHRTRKEGYSWNPSTCICENSIYLKSIADNSVILCDEIIKDTDATNVTNTIPINVTSIVSMNSDAQKVRYKMDCYILHTLLLLIIFQFRIANICYHYTKHRSKQKNVLAH